MLQTVRSLTANVKRRNLFRRTGFSRAAPDFMDSHICQKKEKRRAGYQAYLSFSLSSEAQVRPYFIPGNEVGHYLTCPRHTPVHQTHSLNRPRKVREPRSLLSRSLSNQAIFMPSLFPSINIYLFPVTHTRHIGVTEIKDTISSLKKLTV